MGQHVWLLLATVVTELLVIFKWSKGQFVSFPHTSLEPILHPQFIHISKEKNRY